MDFSGFRIIDETHIQCLQCAHTCKIARGKSGFCQINVNENQTLVNLDYARATALNIDPVEKKPLYHFLPSTKTLSIGTSGCNFRCPFCQNYEISQDPALRGKEITKEEALKIALQYNCKSISFTYNEPTIFYNYAKEYGLFFKERGFKTIFVSNGFFSEESLEDAKSWLDAINIDLKSFDSEYYKTVLKGDLETIKRNLVTVANSGIWLEITTLLIPNITLEHLREMAFFIASELGREIPWHLSRYYPNYKMEDSRPTEAIFLQKAIEIAQSAGLSYVYDGNIGMNLPTTCPKCRQTVLKREGFRAINLLSEEGRCRYCGTSIKGIWR